MGVLGSLVALANIVVLNPFPAQPKEDLDWWEAAIFYQIHPRSLADSDGCCKRKGKILLKCLSYLLRTYKTACLEVNYKFLPIKKF
jgi:hypothetical protein